MFIEAEQNLGTISDLFTTASTTVILCPRVTTMEKINKIVLPKKTWYQKAKNCLSWESQSGGQFGDLAEQST